jgi:hypothetical protein
MNTICWGNTASRGPEIEMEAALDGGSLYVAYSDIRFGTDSIPVGSGATLLWLDGNIDDDPILVADSLPDNSPCISAGMDEYDFGSGNIVYCPANDINRRARPFPAGTLPDMGSMESRIGIPPVIDQIVNTMIPESLTLIQNYPNPFGPGTTIEYNVEDTRQIRLGIYDMNGKLVRVLVNAEQAPGSYKTIWDGTGQNNLPADAGIYFCRMETGEQVKVIKLLLLK